jgi:hypothetical protein
VSFGPYFLFFPAISKLADNLDSNKNIGENFLKIEIFEMTPLVIIGTSFCPHFQTCEKSTACHHPRMKVLKKPSYENGYL